MTTAPPSEEPRAGAARGRRVPVVIVLAGLLVGAVAVGARRVTADPGVRRPAVAASMPAAGVRSSAWYCAGGPVGTGASGDRVTISNVGSLPARVAIDVMVAGRAAVTRLVTVAARSSETESVGKLSPAPAAAVVVQPLGGNVVVEQGFAVKGDVAMAPCATRASTSWYFAAGSSRNGAQQWLSLFNPFAVDSVVDIEAYSEGGLRTPDTLQGLVVPHGARIAVRVDRAVSEQRIVAVAVRTRNDARVVATQALVSPRSGGLANASLSLGALAPAQTWMFADNRSREGASQQLVLANPGDADASARLTVVTDTPTAIEPIVVRVPTTGAVAVDFAGVVPVGAAYTIAVRSTLPVVAETRAIYTDAFDGMVTEVGATASARRWTFAGGPYTATGLGGATPRVPAGYQFVVVMDVGATQEEIAGVAATLKNNGHVQLVHGVSRDEALKAFKIAERNNPALLASVTRAMLPVVFDVQVTADQWVAPLVQFVGGRAGVGSVVTAAKQPAPVADELVVLNPGSRSVQVSVTPTARGTVLSGAGMTKVLLVPGRQVTISLVALAPTGVAVVVDASGPVVAERFTAGPFGVTRSPGVPWLHA